MLKIRAAQLEAFRPVAEAQFALRIIDHLLKKHAKAVVRLPQGPTLVQRLPDALLLEMVQNGIARARSYGLCWESSITGFVILMFKAAPNFDQLPIINRTLRDTQVPPEARMQNILEETNSSDWWDAKERYDPTAWQSKPQGAEE